MEDFEKCKTNGRTGELAVIAFLSEMNYNVIDVADQHLNYDIIYNGIDADVKRQSSIEDYNEIVLETNSTTGNY